MATVIVGLGSNLGDKEENLRHAIREIERQIGPIAACSAFYASEPWGFHSPHGFLNACVASETHLEPLDCLSLLKGIERGMGRLKSASKAYQDRIIDLDILFYDQMVLDSEDLHIPHLLVEKRLFVLEPLAEIAPNWLHPTLGKTVSELLRELSSPS